jgi:tetratricopeptide (TPR) repeat protein
MVTKFKGETYLNTAAAATNLADCLLKRNDTDRLSGDVSHTMSRAEEARDLYQSAYELRMKKYPEGHQSAAASLAGKARALLALGKGKDASECAAGGSEIMKRLNTGPNSTVAELLAVPAQVELESGDFAAARSHLEQAVEALSKSKQVNAVRLAELRCQLGEAMVRSGEVEPGLTLMRENAAAIATAKGDKSVVSRLAQQRLKAAELAPSSR